MLEHHFLADGPGAAVAVVAGGVVVLRECFGLADVPAAAPIDGRTAFDLASVSKMFAATAVLVLAERGRVRLDDPIGRHLDGIGAPREGRAVTIQDLLWHTSGIPEYLSAADLEGRAALTPEVVWERARVWLSDARPGLAHDYSNTNYFLLGRVIESASGQRFGEFLRAALFAPAGMDDTFVLGDAPSSARRARGYRTDGYGAATVVPSELDLPILGDGGIFSTLDDMVRWHAALFGGEILSRESFAHATTRGRLDDGTTFEYGCGLIVEPRAGGQSWVGHTGSWRGAAALFGRYVDRDIGTVVLSNLDTAPVAFLGRRAAAPFLERAAP